MLFLLQVMETTNNFAIYYVNNYPHLNIIQNYVVEFSQYATMHENFRNNTHHNLYVVQICFSKQYLYT